MPQRPRGVVQSFDGTTLVVNERSGAVVSLGLADNFSVNEVMPIEPTAIAPGSYIGTAAMPGPDGSLRRSRCWCSPKRRAAPAKATGPGTCSPAAR